MSAVPHDKAHSAYRILQVAFVIAPIIAGLDKFFYFLTDWSQYLAPFAMNILDGHDRLFMMIVGVVEIIAGIGTIFKPKVFAYIVAIWIALIILNLLIAGEFLDIALRDIGLFLSAIALGKLSQKYN